MVDVPYHTHEFTIPTASEGEIRTGLETSKAITPDKLAPVLADKADKATTLAGYGIQDAASKAQGEKADTAVQPAQISPVGFSGLYNDLSNKPVLGAAAAMNIGSAQQTVAAGDDPRIVNAVQKSRAVTAGEGLSGGGSLAANIHLALSLTSLASLALANSAVQPSALKALAYKDRISTSDIIATGSDDIDAILTKGGKWVKPTGVGDMLQSVWQPIIDENTASRHAHTNKTVLDATTAAFTTDQKTKLAGVATGATANIGTVTSVSVAVPVGWTVTGAITTSGTITLKYAAGYQGYTTAEANKLTGIQAGAQINSIKTVAGRTGDVVLAAADVVSGVFAEARIPALSAGKIPNLDASKTTAGVFADARIPSLNASKIAAGVFSAARIPALGYAPLPYTGTDANNTNYPIGTVILCWNMTASRNGAATPRVGTGDTLGFDNKGSGGLLSGTWRQRGNALSGNALLQRIS